MPGVVVLLVLPSAQSKQVCQNIVCEIYSALLYRLHSLLLHGKNIIWVLLEHLLSSKGASCEIITMVVLLQ